MAGTHYAVNPTTGERLALIDGKWIPATAAGSSSGAPKLTEAQAKDGFNARRMQGASTVLTGLEDKGYDAGLAAINPFGLLGHTREYDAARKEWEDSLLRMTTGAAMTKDEVKHNDETYFPQFGDNADVRKQKSDARARVQRDAIIRGGPASINPPTAQNASPPAQARPAPTPSRAKPIKQMSNAELKAALGL